MPTSQLQAIIDAAVSVGHAPGLCAGVIASDGGTEIACAGVRDVGSAAPMADDTLFMIASCSKVVTSMAALQLVERGLLDLDDPVGKHLPLLAHPRVLTGFDAAGDAITRPAKGTITLRHLLTHTSGLAYDFTSEAMAAYLAATGITLLGPADPDTPLLFDPGTGWLYGTGIDWAGRLIEEASGQSLDAYVHESILAPLGMNDTAYFPDPAQSARKAGVCLKAAPGSFSALPMAMPSEPHFMMGGAGLHATTGDYLKLLRVLLAHGAPLLARGTFDLMMQNHVGDIDAGSFRSANPMLSRDFVPLPGVTRRHGLAGLVNLDPVPGGRAIGSLSWAGIANCYYWADPTSGVAGVLMAQVLPFADPEIMETFEAVERAAYA